MHKCTTDLDVGLVASLDALHKADPHARGEVGVLPVGLTTPTPPGVSEDIDVGSKAVQSPAM